MVMGKPLDILVLGLVSAWLFAEGVQCQGDDYTLQAPHSVSVQEGLCVLIPCSFTYRASDDENNAQLYGYWYEQGSSNNPAMATNDPDKRIANFARDRFRLIGDVNQNNCSLVIDQAGTRDWGGYYFRIEKGRLKYSYRNIRVNVKARVRPKIQTIGSLRAGHPANVTCMPPESCSWRPLHINWTGAVGQNGTSTAELRNGVYSSTLNFIPSAVDHEQDLICNVYHGGLHMETTVRLNVSFPPQQLRISGEILLSNGTRKEFTNASEVEANDGDSVQLRCEADANPSSSISWRRQSPVSSNSQLNLNHVNMESKGKYWCVAQNTEGSNETTLRLRIRYSPMPCKLDNSHCWKDGSRLSCNCSICSYPSPDIQWKVGRLNLTGNTTRGNMHVNTWNLKERTTSTLHLTGQWEEEPSIICLASNPSGQLSTRFIIFNSATGDTLKQSIISGVAGAFLILVLGAIILIAFLVFRKRRKSVTNSARSSKPPIVVHGETSPGAKNPSAGLSHLNENSIYEVPKMSEEAPGNGPNDGDNNLYYADLQFNPKPTSESSFKDTGTEYAEIKARPSTDISEETRKAS